MVCVKVGRVGCGIMWCWKCSVFFSLFKQQRQSWSTLVITSIPFLKLSYVLGMAQDKRSCLYWTKPPPCLWNAYQGIVSWPLNDPSHSFMDWWSIGYGLAGSDCISSEGSGPRGAGFCQSCSPWLWGYIHCWKAKSCSRWDLLDLVQGDWPMLLRAFSPSLVC